MAAERSQGKPHILGLTGPIACGKSTVGDLLLELGVIERIDADSVVHTLMAGTSSITASLRERFGERIVDEQGKVDRRALGAHVFGDPAALHDLEGLTHPAVRQVIRSHLQALSGRQGVVVLDAIKLLQSELLPLCDEVWVVRCDKDTQTRRLRENRGMDADETRNRVAAGPSFDHPAVTTIIDNSGSRVDLERQVREAWNRLMTSQE